MSPDDLRELLALPGRSVSVHVYGDTADQLELAALDAAGEFFGTARQLVIIPGWLAIAAGGGAPGAYVANIVVRGMEP